MTPVWLQGLVFGKKKKTKQNQKQSWSMFQLGVHW